MSQMTIGDLKKAIADMPDDQPLFFRRIVPIAGNIEAAGSIESSTYGFFGSSIPCVIIEPMKD